MNRPIKFRVWDSLTKKMVGAFIRDDGVIFGSIIDIKVNTPITDMPLMQFTGLTDKSGKEIYEGDIVKAVETKIKYEVKFRAETHFMSWMIQPSEGKPSLLIGYPEQLEIIGNIYENPELLKNSPQGMTQGVST